MAVQPEELQRHNSARIDRKRGVQRRARNRQERIASWRSTDLQGLDPSASRKRRKRLHFVANTTSVERSACEFVNNESLRKTAAIGAAYFTGQTHATNHALFPKRATKSPWAFFSRPLVRGGYKPPRRKKTKPQPPPPKKTPRCLSDSQLPNELGIASKPAAPALERPVVEVRQQRGHCRGAVAATSRSSFVESRAGVLR
jgi:hypothetical protein